MLKLIVVVRIRGKTNVSKKVNDTLDMMCLYKQNGCVVVPNTPAYLGMLRKAKDYITWGEIDEETLKLLLQKRGRVVGGKALTEDYLKNHAKMDMASFVQSFLQGETMPKDVPGMKRYFRLTPPRKGFAYGGIKRPYSMGGALGYRKDDINILVKRMI